jgi:hypothetical protein
MNPADREQHLERLMQRTLRDLPSRRAPASLEACVMVEIERRSALPWWRKSFVHWPVAARAALLVGLVAVMTFTLLGMMWAMSGIDAARYRELFATPLAWMQACLAIGRAIGDFVDIILRNLPALWLYGAVAFVVTMYAALFGLGAAAYRTLYARR